MVRRLLTIMRLGKKSFDRSAMFNLSSPLTSTTTMRTSIQTWQHCRRAFGLARIGVLCVDAHMTRPSYAPETNNNTEVGR